LLTFVILPSGDTLLHRIAENQKLLEQFLLKAHPIENGDNTIKYYIPILPNRENKTAFDILFSKNMFKSLNLMLQCFKIYEIDHHSRFITKLFKEFLDKDLPEFPDYISARLLQTDQLKKITKGALNKK
jgi:hypothetical protein